MKKVLVGLVSLVVVVAILVGIDLVARSWAQSQLASYARADAHASSASASIGSFPVLYRLLATGSVPEVDVDLSEVPLGPLRLSSVAIDMHHVVMSRHALVYQRRVLLTGIASGSIDLTVTAAELSSAIGHQIQLTDGGQVSFSVLGHSISVTPTIAAGDVLQLGFTPSLVLRLTIPTSSLVPCVSTVTVTAGLLHLSCVLDHVPPALVRAVAGSGSPG